MSESETIDVPAVVEMPQQRALAPSNLFHTEDPDEVIAKASSIATALSDVIESKDLSSTIQGRKYVRVEGWTLLGSMLGVFPVCEWSRRVEGGTPRRCGAWIKADNRECEEKHPTHGWEARVEVRTLGGQTVGAAEASCLRSEHTWSDRDDYALRSMAQTRATAKALRQPLGFVVTMAGYEATPQEEMPRETEPGRPFEGGRTEPAPERQAGEPDWIDRPLGFGRHRERSWRYVADEHPDYLEWVRDKADRVPGKAKEYASRMLIAGGRRIENPEADAHLDLAADAAWDEDEPPPPETPFD